MSKTLAALVLLLVLSAAGCGPAPAEAPAPLPLPYVLYEQEDFGNRVTITLASACGMVLEPGQYCFQLELHQGEWQTTAGANIVTIHLTEGYRPDMDVDWAERIGDQEGSGGIWTGEIEPGTDLWHEVAFGLGEPTREPVAVFVRVTGTDGGAVVTQMDTSAPVAVLQILPDGQGVARVDE